MEFCEKCGDMMRPSDKGILECKKCSLVEKGELIFNEKEKKAEKKGAGVVKDEDIYATYPHKCRKCGFDKADVTFMGPWYSDEDTVTQVRCGKCGFAEVLERKTG